MSVCEWEGCEATIAFIVRRIGGGGYTAAFCLEHLERFGATIGGTERLYKALKGLPDGR